MIKSRLIVAILFSSHILFAQEKLPSISSSVQPADFDMVSQISDTAAAVVLLDSSSCILTANPQRGFYTIHHHLRRVLVLKSDALNPGEVNVGTYWINYNKEYNGDKKLKSLKVSTYNLENGRVVETVLPDKDVFITTDKKKDDYVQVKFAFPNARVGSILEMEYTADNYSSDLLDWYFQEQFPVKKAVYHVSIPEIWNFVMTSQNNKYITGIKRDSIKKTFYSWQYNYEDVTSHSITWTAENILAMREQPFTSTSENYIGCVKFQLSIRPLHPGYSERVINDWQWFDNRLTSYSDFGSEIDAKEHPWARKIINEQLGEADNNLILARRIFAMVRDHFHNSGRGIVLSKYQSLKEIYESGAGSTADINLALILMLRSQKFKADPLILSTRDNGFTNAEYPILERYNYTICRLEINGVVYYLDASDRKIGFGKLPTQCYNGHARVITKPGYAIYLTPDSVKESSRCFATVKIDSASNALILNCTQTLGYYESLDIRHQLEKTTIANYIKSITGTKTPDGTIDSFSFSDLDSLDRPISLVYSMKIASLSTDNLYFTPLLNYGLGKNPFISSVRDYPVELPYTFDKLFVLNMDIPDGFEVDELPKSERLALNENEGSFEYLIQKNPYTIQLKSMLSIKKSAFDPEDYNMLRNFYTEVIKKQSDLIVFKKTGKDH